MVRLLISTFFLLALTTCGGGGGGGTVAPETVPQISNLQMSRTFVPYLDGGGTSSITGTFDYYDADADLVSVEIELSDGTALSIPIGGPLPGTSGTLIGEITFSTDVLGVYIAKIWVVDDDGHVSNTLTALVTIAVDITQWTYQNSPTALTLRDVIWNGALYVAVGDAGTVITSPDGVNWTPRASGTINNLNALIWDGARFIAVGDAETIIESPDGLNWSDAVSVIAQGDLNAVATSGVMYVAAGAFGNDSVMLWSLDGSNWVENQGLVLSNREVYDIAWSGIQFVASTVLNAFPNDARVMVSTDGMNWIDVVVSNDALSGFSTIWTGNEFIIGSIVGRILESPDGINWTVLDTGSPSNLWAVGWNGINFMAGGNAGLVGTYDDGATWVTTNIVTDIRSVVWGDTQFVAVGQGGLIVTTP